MNFEALCKSDPDPLERIRNGEISRRMNFYGTFSDDDDDDVEASCKSLPPTFFIFLLEPIAEI